MQITGIISKLEAGYAYALTEKGNVFIPNSAAKSKNGEQFSSLLDRFFQNETVQLTIVKQPNGGKNGCVWMAKSVKKLEKSSAAGSSRPLSDEVHGPMNATVTVTSPTYAFATTEMGTVFIPGDAFDADFVRNVERDIRIGDQLTVRIKEQMERSGCKWVAMEAVKSMVFKEEEIREIAESNKEYVMGYGYILDLSPMEALVLDEKKNISVHCSLLTYTGGNRGNRLARTLQDITKPNDVVMYKASYTPNVGYDAVDWKLIVETENMRVPRDVKQADSFTQTTTDTLAVMFKRFMIENPAEMDRILPVIDHFPDQALPDHYIVARDNQRRQEKAAAEEERLRRKFKRQN
uniref:Ribonuclease FAU-1 n=1 Tax=Caenorhabditis tropicalis TaxID=1561998 RepID=A0A1I7UZA8_9PELO